MKSLPNSRIVTFVRQEELYTTAGQSGEFTIAVPFAANFSDLLNVEALSAAGIDALGLARQMDQLLVENIGNSWAAKAKAAAAKGLPLPTQADIDALVAAYDFTGTRTRSEESMSVQERTILAEIRKAFRTLINGGLLANQPLDPEAEVSESNPVIFNIVRVQTKPETETEVKGKDENGEPVVTIENRLQPNNLSLEDFEALCAAAMANEPFTLTDSEGRSVELPLDEAPIFDGDQPANYSAITEQARREAATVLAKRAAKAALPKAMKLRAAA